MMHSDNINELATALAKAQGALEGAKKDAANDAFKRNGKASKYADLASIWDACRDTLSKNGLSVIQAPGECVDNRVALTTMLVHSSGQWVQETLTIPLPKVDAHGYGSATTYARRYALAAMVGIIQEDDDGNAAAASGNGGGADNSSSANGAIDDAQYAHLLTLIEASGADTKRFCAYMKVPAVKAIKARDYKKAVAALEAKIKPAPEPEMKEAA